MMRPAVGPAAPGTEGTLTFLAVVLVVVQHEAAAALTAVAAEGVDALVLAASVFFGTLVDICRDAEQTLNLLKNNDENLR